MLNSDNLFNQSIVSNDPLTGCVFCPVIAPLGDTPSISIECETEIVLGLSRLVGAPSQSIFVVCKQGRSLCENVTHQNNLV
jgi:hypothetical protein